MKTVTEVLSHVPADAAIAQVPVSLPQHIFNALSKALGYLKPPGTIALECFSYKKIGSDPENPTFRVYKHLSRPIVPAAVAVPRVPDGWAILVDEHGLFRIEQDGVRHPVSFDSAEDAAKTAETIALCDRHLLKENNKLRSLIAALAHAEVVGNAFPMPEIRVKVPVPAGPIQWSQGKVVSGLATYLKIAKVEVDDDGVFTATIDPS